MKISKAIDTGLFDPKILGQEIASKKPCISYHSMRRSSRVLREFLLYYFPLYNLSYNDFFGFYPILGFVEALVYETDEEVEEIQSNCCPQIKNSPWTSKQKIILSVLQEINIKHEKIDFYLKDLGEYFDLETYLLSGYSFDESAIIKAAELRSSDYRLLHSILAQMLNLNCRKEDMVENLNLMFPLEVLNDIEDDLISYADDVGVKHYNTYRMFVKLYGEKAPFYLKKKLDYYESLFHKQIAVLSSLKKKPFIQAWNAYRLDHSVPTIPDPIFED
ncbi:hypothetical protein QUA40_21235 [Microcoleus sp. Pol11C3]|uniref:hypothetical protein n=1 Tax=Microcoleus sp. Pol11C3 TaxID=3055390 RepID=UPI002FD5F5E6